LTHWSRRWGRSGKERRWAFPCAERLRRRPAGVNRHGGRRDEDEPLHRQPPPPCRERGRGAEGGDEDPRGNVKPAVRSPCAHLGSSGVRRHASAFGSRAIAQFQAEIRLRSGAGSSIQPPFCGRRPLGDPRRSAAGRCAFDGSQKSYGSPPGGLARPLAGRDDGGTRGASSAAQPCIEMTCAWAINDQSTGRT